MIVGRKIMIVLGLAALLTTGYSQERLQYHLIRTDPNGFILPWYDSPRFLMIIS